MSADGLLAKWGASLTSSFERRTPLRYHAAGGGKGRREEGHVDHENWPKNKTNRVARGGDAGAEIHCPQATFYGHEVASAVERASTERIGEILEGLEKSGLIIRRPLKTIRILPARCRSSAAEILTRLFLDNRSGFSTSWTLA